MFLRNGQFTLSGYQLYFYSPTAETVFNENLLITDKKGVPLRDTFFVS
jgi:hypothetical protein